MKQAFKRTITTILLIFPAIFVLAQTTVSGVVTTKQGEPIPGVNIFIKDTYDGASSDDEGRFTFRTSENAKQVLMATFIGYKSWEQEIDLTSDIKLKIELQESVNTLDAVTITAGSFTADDEGRASVMKPLDIYTTPSANGDVMAAIRTMPGTQASADDGRLLVRGGDVYETATYIDGLVAAKPYYSKTPDVATRGRFSPSLFNGVQFNTGGYSAEYGQALSSVLVLNSTGKAENDNTGISLMSVGGEANHTSSWDKSSLMLSGGYINFSGYDKIFNSNIDWEKPVESVNGTAVFRYKPRSSGLFKAYVTTDYGNLAYNVPAGSDGHPMKISNRGTTVYSNLSYRDCISDKSCYRVGVSSTFQDQQTGLAADDVNTREWSVETRFALVHDLSEGVKLTWGANGTSHLYNQDYIQDEGETYTGEFDDHLLGVFVEPEIKFSKNLAIRPGIRSEYSSVINRWNVAPRFAVALKTGENAQLSGAWGMYHQTPQPDYLKLTTDLDFEKATHYILSYQFGDVSERLFRAEAYYKTYSDLVTYSAEENGLPSNLQNTGDGYAGGLDIFWRDQKTIKGFDYWVTYSYIDTKRKYKYYPEKATPEFISDHTFSVVGKYWVNKINTQIGMSFTAASGRPYNDPNSTVFNGEKTKMYSDLSLNFSHVFYLGNQYSVFYCSVNNVLGNDNILSYRPSDLADAQGNYNLIPVKRDLKRMVFMGLFLNF
ncbi:TonB-dependent receptor plug domain-containing protein [Maribellus sediminis]|uniref:TonB-dependent receptor plug domain-containing protein n=1 Tax=Maribellus sediminis TaxID=2696285 RepID=UPI00142F78F1|nr:carboxypeptidase-like regulatory domain-containing protein [Maribellus sediminis]